jgi:hypothetical protein
MRMAHRMFAAMLVTLVSMPLQPQQSTTRRAVDWAKVFTESQNPEDLRKALQSVEEPLWDGPEVRNAQGGVQRKFKKLDAAYEQRLAPWLEFYAALDNVEATMREHKMPTPYYPGPPAPSTMDGEQQIAYEGAVRRNEEARIYWNKLSEIRTIRQQASALFWTWTGGALRNEPEVLKKVEFEALAADCLPARVAWMQSVLGADQRTFPPGDASIADEKPVKP